MSKPNSKLTAERLRSLLEYLPDTGGWRWRIGTARRVKVGDVAGWARSDGRWQISVLSKTYYGSRLAWLYMTGEWPEREVDHRDLDKTNDRWDNLRQGTHTQNQANSRARRHNRAGLKGVSYEKPGRYQAKISVDGKTVYLGHFSTADAAHAAYCAAAKARHEGFFRSQ